MQTLAPLDWIVIGGYFALILCIVWWSSRRLKKTSDSYFLAGRELGWFIVGASIFASNIGSEHLVGLAASGTTDGVALAHYELHAWCLLVLGWVMVPFYMRSKVFTTPEFLERRFSPAARTLLSMISLVAYVLTKIAVGIYAGGIVFSVLLPEANLLGLDSFWVGSLLVVVVTGAYTIIGGMEAVAYTEAVQTVVLVIGSALVLWFGLDALGGWSELRAIVPAEMFNLWKPIVPDGVAGSWSPVRTPTEMAWYFNDNYPWIGMVLCAPFIGLWYWCTDQYIVQRTLIAPDEREARRGTIAAAFIKLTPVFIFILPGIVCYALALSGKIPALREAILDADGNVIRAQAQQAFPLMVAHVLPVGIRGIVVAGLLAALMSSLAGAFNASATLFTIDFYSRLRPGSSQERLVWIGRFATAIMVLIGILWIPVIRGGKGLYDYLQGMQAYLAPPIAVVFFFGVFSKRLTARGCMAALVVGFVMGIARLAIDTPVKLFEGFAYTEGTFLWIVNNIFFQYYSLLILIVSAIVMVAASYAGRAPDPSAIEGLTYGTLTAGHRQASRSSWDARDAVLSIVVLALIAASYLFFTG
jgi:SSS family solute:Na+ symporter